MYIVMITRLREVTVMDSYGIKLVEIAAGAVIGAALNVVTGGIAATVTGQKYTLKDMMAAAAAGAIAGGFSVAKYSSLKVLGAVAGGLFSAGYTI